MKRWAVHKLFPKNLNSGNIIHNEFVKYADIPQMLQLQICALRTKSVKYSNLCTLNLQKVLKQNFYPLKVYSSHLNWGVRQVSFDPL
jgi:hypothetical protein